MTRSDCRAIEQGWTTRQAAFYQNRYKLSSSRVTNLTSAGVDENAGDEGMLTSTFGEQCRMIEILMREDARDWVTLGSVMIESIILRSNKCRRVPSVLQIR